MSYFWNAEKCGKVEKYQVHGHGTATYSSNAWKEKVEPRQGELSGGSQPCVILLSLSVLVRTYIRFLLCESLSVSSVFTVYF